MTVLKLAILSLAVAGLLLAAGDVNAARKKRYKEVEVKNGGTIEGTVVFKGQVPMVKTPIPEKDRATCGNDRNEPILIVGKDQGVKDVIVYLRRISKGKKWLKPAKPLVLRNAKCHFEPHVMVARVGKLKIINEDPVLHNNHGYYGQRTAFNMAIPKQGETILAPLRRGGMAAIRCDVHAWMHAHVYITRKPYYTITGVDGRFSIADIPPGKYTLFVRQGNIKNVEVPVEVGANGRLNLTVELHI